MKAVFRCNKVALVVMGVAFVAKEVVFVAMRVDCVAMKVDFVAKEVDFVAMNVDFVAMKAVFRRHGNSVLPVTMKQFSLLHEQFFIRCHCSCVSYAGMVVVFRHHGNSFQRRYGSRFSFSVAMRGS